MESKLMDKLLLGIDFGTSTNFVTKYDFAKKDAVTVENMGGYGSSNIFDNAIYIESGTNVVLGHSANKKGLSDPMNHFSNIKRYIDSDHWEQKIPHLDYRIFSAQQIAEMIFREIKERVEKNENRSIDGVVLTVPYAYGDLYRKRLKEASENAGMKVLKIIEEPVAAAISFGIFDKKLDDGKKEKILVFDLGGGTLDITVFEMSKTGSKTVIEVLNTDGVKQLGGKDIDDILVKKFQNLLGTDYSEVNDSVELKRYQEGLSSLAKATKENLSEDEEYDIYENYTINGEPKELEFDLERKEFEMWLKTNNIIGEIKDALDRSLMDIEDEDIEPEDIDRVILAGGSSSIPLIYKTVEEYFGKAPETRKNLGELIGHGAGLVAGMTADDSLQYKIIRKVSKNIGLAKGNRFETILAKNTPYGEWSPAYMITVDNLADSDLKIHLYEGDSAIVEHCEKIGSISAEVSGLKTSELGIALSKDEKEGRLNYRLYDGETVLKEDKI
jgi:molecular chaperone DnaK